MPLREEEQDLLLSDAQHIAHQCNCTTRRARGLAETLFARFPHADTYSSGAVRVPGTITVAGGQHLRSVVNLYAQRAPGRSSDASGDDTAEARLGWFRECLRRVAELEGLESVAFPFRIGCGLGGGDWTAYKAELQAFADSLPEVDVVVCHPPAAPPPKRRRAQRGLSVRRDCLRLARPRK